MLSTELTGAIAATLFYNFTEVIQFYRSYMRSPDTLKVIYIVNSWKIPGLSITLLVALLLSTQASLSFSVMYTDLKMLSSVIEISFVLIWLTLKFYILE